MRPSLLIAVALAAWQQPPARGPHRIEVTLERLERSAWRAIDPGLVLDSGDRVRFRFRAGFDGYLYVTNHGTSGASTLLFPREETGRDNAVKAGREYLVPAAAGARFRVGGPPGQDVVYWLMTPMALGAPPPAPQPKPETKTLLPRCDDAIFHARGECVDSSAGPRARSRELVILRRGEQSVISSPAPLEGPLIYEFRLAHR